MIWIRRVATASFFQYLIMNERDDTGCMFALGYPELALIQMKSLFKFLELFDDIDETSYKVVAVVVVVVVVVVLYCRSLLFIVDNYVC